MKYLKDLPDHVRDFISSKSFQYCTLLNEIQKKVIFLRFFQELNYTQISKCIQRSGPIAKHTIDRSLHLIEKYLKKKTPDMLISDSELSDKIKYALRYDTQIKRLSDFNNLSIYSLKERFKRCGVVLGNSSFKQINDYIKDLGFSLDFPEEKKQFQGRFDRKDFMHLTDKEILKLICSLSKLIMNRK